jgi:ABC-2 type transport system permease protein
MSKPFWQIITIARTEFLLRDQGTFLGFLWTLINPLLLFVSLYGVFYNSTLSTSTAYATYLLAGMLLWNFFAQATSNLGVLILTRGQYLHSSTVTIPVLMIAALVVQCCISICEALIGFALLALIFHTPVIALLHYITGVIFIMPLVLLCGSLLIWLQSRLNDTARLWGLALRIGFFLTPIFYYQANHPLIIAAQRYNPLIPILALARGELVPSSIYISTTILLCAAVVAVTITEKNRARLVELQ